MVPQALTPGRRFPDLVVSALLAGDPRFVGAATAAHDEPRRLAADPFVPLLPTRWLRFGPDPFGRTPSPVGSATQRCGSDNPWPVGRVAP